MSFDVLAPEADFSGRKGKRASLSATSAREIVEERGFSAAYRRKEMGL
jgi:hypothetical protein